MILFVFICKIFFQLKFNDFLFAVFAGKKQPKQVEKCQKFKNKLNFAEAMKTFEKNSAKCTNFEVSDHVKLIVII